MMPQGAGVEGKPPGSQWVASAQGPRGGCGVHSSVSSAATQAGWARPQSLLHILSSQPAAHRPRTYCPPPPAIYREETKAQEA